MESLGQECIATNYHGARRERVVRRCAAAELGARRRLRGGEAHAMALRACEERRDVKKSVKRGVTGGVKESDARPGRPCRR